jgi:adenylosuccinate synthase
MGFYPHVSAIRTLPSFTHGMLQKAGHKGDTVNIGVSRAYAVRHGAGPMPTDTPEQANNLLPNSHKEDNRYQGRVRVGPIDFVLLRYALAACGGPAAFDGLAITWFDQIQVNASWQQCRRYRGVQDSEFFLPSGDIRVVDNPNPEHQIALGQQLSKCQPEVMATPVMANVSQDELFDICAEVVQAQTGVPVRMVSFGATERDQVCK